MKIEGSVAIVTGGASGIGKAICEKLLQGGAKVSKPLIREANTIISEISHSVIVLSLKISVAIIYKNTRSVEMCFIYH